LLSHSVFPTRRSSVLSSARLDAVSTNRGQYAGRLFAAHHRNTGVGPHEQQARTVRAAAHAVVPGPEGATNDHGEFRHGSGGYSRDHFGAMARDAFVFVASSNHEAADVLQENQGNLALAAQFDEMGAFLCRL